jgi:hypothetical protein
MSSTAASREPQGFVARNNEVIGSIASIIALVVAVLLGAGLMFGTDTRGVRAILTVLTVAGGTFTILLQVIGATLRSATTEAAWNAEEQAFREEMGLPGLSAEVVEAQRIGRRRATWLGALAVLVGLCLSLLPAMF